MKWQKSNLHAHDLLVALQNLVAHLHRQLEGELRPLGSDHDGGDVGVLARGQPDGQPVGLLLAGVDLGQCGLQGLAESLRSEEHTSELQSRENLVCRLLLEKKKKENETK